MGGISNQPVRWGAIRLTIDVLATLVTIRGQNGVFSSATYVAPAGGAAFIARLEANTQSWPAARTMVIATAERAFAHYCTVVRVDDDTIEIRVFAGPFVLLTAIDVDVFVVQMD